MPISSSDLRSPQDTFTHVLDVNNYLEFEFVLLVFRGFTVLDIIDEQKMKVYFQKS